MGEREMIVLDTHVLIWWVDGADKLSRTAASMIRRAQAEDGIMISSITAWEIAMLVDRGRLTLTMDVSAWLSTVSRVRGIKFIPVDNPIAIGAVDLPGEFQKDPADRLIVATARRFGVPLVTQDRRIRSYPHLKTVW
jgi:PIN domain nuclease of toxin-antitoxin system